MKKTSFSTDQQKPPNVIYHYTTYDGLLGILNSKSLWSTDILYLNDAQENRVIFDLAKRFLLDEEEVRELFASSVIDYINKTRGPNVFVSSFSEDGDLLSQWRAYGKMSSSVSIGFKRTELMDLSKKQAFDLKRCIYDQDDQKELIRKGYDVIFKKSQKVNSGKKYIEPVVRSTVISKQADFVNYLMNIAPLIKDKGFREEKEWRLISTPDFDKKILFRSGSSFLIPYCEFNLHDLNNLIESVVIGPTPHPRLAYNSLLSIFCESSLDSKGKVRITEIPYRNW